MNKYFLRILPFLLSGTIILVVAFSVWFSANPLYQEALLHESRRTQASLVASEVIIQKQILEVSRIAQMVASQSNAQDAFFKALGIEIEDEEDESKEEDDEGGKNKKSDENISEEEKLNKRYADIFRESVNYMQSFDLEFLSFVDKDFKVVMGLGLYKKVGESLNHWEIFQEGNIQDQNLKKNSGVTLYENDLYTIGIEPVYHTGTYDLIGYVLAGRLLDDVFMDDLSKALTSQAVLAIDKKVRTSTISLKAAQKIVEYSEDKPFLYEEKRYSLGRLPLKTMGEKLVGEIIIAYSLAPFDMKFKSIFDSILFYISLPILVSILGIFYLSNQIKQYILNQELMYENQYKLLIATRSLLGIEYENDCYKETMDFLGKQFKIPPESHFEFFPLAYVFENEKLSSVWKKGTLFVEDDYLYIPLVGRKYKIGLISISQFPLKFLNSHEKNFLESYSVSISTTIESIRSQIGLREKALEDQKKLGEELAIASIQKHLIHTNLHVPHVSMSNWYKSADSAGGDWFGAYYDEAHKYALFFIADVTGHGISAALITAIIYGSVMASERRMDENHLIYDIRSRLMDCAKMLHYMIYQASHGEKCATFCAVALEVDTGSVYWLNAGHNPPLWWSQKDQKCHVLRSTGSSLGLEEKVSSFEVLQSALSPQDVLCLYTDGLIENGPEDGKLSKREIQKILKQDLSVDGMSDLIKEKAKGLWKDTPLDDDVTLFLLQWSKGVEK